MKTSQNDALDLSFDNSRRLASVIESFVGSVYTQHYIISLTGELCFGKIVACFTK